MFESNKIIINQNIFSKLQVEVLYQSAKLSPTIQGTHIENNLAVTDTKICDIQFIDYSDFREQVEYVVEQSNNYL